MIYKAIIFDMDGTIIDTEGIWKRANKELIKSRGVTVTPEMEQELALRLRGMALHKSCAIIKEIAQLNDPLEELIQEKAILANNFYAQGIKYIDGFLTFHQELMVNKIPTAIATNAVPSTVAVTDQILDLQKLFKQHIYNISHVNNIGKPDPALYLHVAKQLDIDPADCIAFEDSAHGIAAAKDAGMYCVGINTGKDREQLRRSDHIIDAYAELKLAQLLAKNK